jgi:T5SS/PEP-CTERM-associated repeat protein
VPQNRLDFTGRDGFNPPHKEEEVEMRLISARVVFRGAVVAVLLPAFVPACRAQFSADYQTNIISGVVSNWTGSYVVGSNTVFDLLRIESGGMLSNTSSYIGYESSASNNSVLVSGSGSAWSNCGTLYVGYSSAGNSLTISNGGAVLAQEIIVGNVSNSEGTVNIVGGFLVANAIVVTELLGATGRFHAINAGILAATSTYIKDGEMYLSNCTAAVSFLGIAPGSGTHGTLIAADSTLTVSGDLSIGDYFVGTATVWIAGGHLAATNSDTYVSNFGGGQMTCSNSVVNLATLTVGSSSAKAGTLTISGGSFLARQFDVAHGGIASTGVVSVCDGAIVIATNDPSIVGESGIGAMTISNSTVRLASLTLAKYFLVDTIGTLTVAGGTVTISGTLTAAVQGNRFGGTRASIWLDGGKLVATNALSYIGVSGTGQMNISNGVYLASTVTVDGRGSTLTLAGGTALVSDSLFIGSASCTGSGVVAVAGGSLYVTNAAHTGTVEVRNGTLSISGGLLVADQLVMTSVCARFVRNGGTLFVGSVVLDPSLDADGDGIANGWEQSYGLDPLNAADASADSDGDGFTNLQEYQAGTDPTNSASAFRILSVVPTNDDLLISWVAGGGRTNVVQSTADLTGSYTNVSPNIILTGNGDATTNYLDTGATTNATSRFYRIRLVP